VRRSVGIDYCSRCKRSEFSETFPFGIILYKFYWNVCFIMADFDGVSGMSPLLYIGYLANAMSPSVNLIATGRWFKGMKGAAASSLKNMTNKGVTWRGVSDTLLTLNGILKRTSSIWRQLFHCLMVGVGEMGEFTHSSRHTPTDRLACCTYTWQTLVYNVVVLQ
jgi:hypothetical protein